MLENDVKYRITMKTMYHIIGLLLVFKEKRAIDNETY